MGNSKGGWTDACEFGDEKGEADTDRGDKGGLVLLRCEHKNGEDELGGKEHFDEKSLHNRGAATERRADVGTARKKHKDHGGGGDGAKYLRHHNQAAADIRHSTDEAHTEGHLEATFSWAEERK